MKKLLLALLFAPVVCLAQINQYCPQFTVNGTPQYQPGPGDQEETANTIKQSPVKPFNGY